MVSRGSGKTAQPATCLLVVLLSVALVALPSLRTRDATSDPSAGAPLAPRAPAPATLRRALLSTALHAATNSQCKYLPEELLGDDDVCMEDLMSLSQPHPDHDYQVVKRKSSSGKLPNGYMEIPIDEEWPPNPKTRIKPYEFDLDDGQDYLPPPDDLKNQVKADLKIADYNYAKLGVGGTDDFDNIQVKLDNLLSKSTNYINVGSKFGDYIDIDSFVAVKNEDIITEEVDHAMEPRNFSETRTVVIQSEFI